MNDKSYYSTLLKIFFKSPKSEYSAFCQGHLFGKGIYMSKQGYKNSSYQFQLHLTKLKGFINRLKLFLLIKQSKNHKAGPGKQCCLKLSGAKQVSLRSWFEQ